MSSLILHLEYPYVTKFGIHHGSFQILIMIDRLEVLCISGTQMLT